MKTKLILLTLLASLLEAETNQNAVNTKTKPNTGTPGTFAASLINVQSNTSWVDQKIEEIKPQRRGLSSASLARLKSPFIVIKEERKEEPKSSAVKEPSTDTKDALPTRKDMSKEPLTLQIILNSSALINGKWLKENDVFRGYKLTQIQSSHVVLERKNKKIKLFIAQKNKKLNISTK